MANYQQTFPNSCGAVALMCAAIELGVTEIPDDRSIHPLWIGGLELNGRPSRQAEIMIYAVTSGGTGAPTNDSGYSLPSNIALAATALNLDTTAYVPQSIISSFLTVRYPSEFATAQRNGMSVRREQAPTLQPYERRLRIMRVGRAGWFRAASGLHYILERPDGSVMDPALGHYYTSLVELQRLQRSMANIAYIDTGITITVDAIENSSIFGNLFQQR